MTAGVLAKSAGFASTFDVSCNADLDGPECTNRAHETPFAVKDVVFMLHELPMMSYLRVGHFIPPFGTMFDDHTLGVRRDFELDQGLLNSRVTGIEVGMAPNYPYFHFAYFRPNRQDRFLDNPDAPSVDSMPPCFGVSINGLDVRLRYDYSDFDTCLADDHYHRFAGGLDLILLPGVQLSALYRLRLNPGGSRVVNNDVIIYLRAWY